MFANGFISLIWFCVFASKRLTFGCSPPDPLQKTASQNCDSQPVLLIGQE